MEFWLVLWVHSATEIGSLLFYAHFVPKKNPKNCHSSYYTPLGKTWARANPQDEYLTGIDSEYDHSTK